MSHDMKVLMVSYKIPAVVEMTTDATKVVVADSAIENAVVLSSFNSLRRDGKDVHWIGTPSGVWGDQMTENEKRSIREDLLDANRMVPVFLGAEQARLHFSQFCKRFLWPMFHYYGNSTDFNFSEWDAFREVNDEFARVTIEEIARQRGIHYEDTLHERDRSKSPNLMPMSPVLSGIGSPRPRYSLNDGKFLSESTSYAQLPLDVSEFAFVVQDYHLMLVPYYLRKRAPSAKISFFLHIPWPSSEIYRSLPIRDQLLQGLLSADMLSFQSFTFARHFLSCCTRILGLKVSDKGVHMNDGRFVRIEVMPIGIDAQFWERKLSQPETKKRMDELVQSVQGKKVLVSRDRMDYVKGIPTKLKAFRTFLTMYPEYQGKVVLFQECMPNPDINVLNDRSYKELEESIGQLVGSINGQYGSIAYTPIVYINRSVPAEESAAMYAIADLGIILPLRDGMNLSAYEFIVCQAEKQSPLILSEFAGAAQCLSGAVLANPWNEKKIAKLIRKCLEMPQEEKLTRFTNNFNYVKSHTNLHWISNLVRETCTSLVMPVRSEDVPELSYGAAKKEYEKANKRLIFLDYDGTLTPIVKMPHLATPSSETLNLLSALAADPKNRVYVISGRDRKFLEEWLGTIPIGLSGEHGSFVRPYPKDPEGPLPPWQMTIKDLDLSWKDAVMSIFEDYTDRTPGSFIEVKEVNITWHYRNADPDFGDYQRNQLILYLQGFGVKLPVDVINGDKAVEVRPPGINKGAIIKRVIGEEEDWDYVLCMGDDTTDEDMFAELKKYEEEENKSIFSCMVKKKPTMATNYVENQRGVLDLLHTLLGNKTEKPKSGHERRMLRNL